MDEIFRGWKRKAGVMTLVVACMFAAGWVRSISLPEEIKAGSYVPLPQSIGEIYISNKNNEVEVTSQTAGSRRPVFGLFYPPIVIILTIVAARLLMPESKENDGHGRSVLR